MADCPLYVSKDLIGLSLHQWFTIILNRRYNYGYGLWTFVAPIKKQKLHIVNLRTICINLCIYSCEIYSYKWWMYVRVCSWPSRPLQTVILYVVLSKTVIFTLLWGVAKCHAHIIYYFIKCKGEKKLWKMQLRFLKMKNLVL